MSFTYMFIAHSSIDSLVAQRMLEYLEASGIRCWIAPRDIPLGMQWAEAILDAIEEASAMLLILSASSNDSPQVLREVERAVNKRVPIYPVKIEDIEPCRAMEYYLSSHQWKEVFTGDLEEKLSQLVPTIMRQLGIDGAESDGDAAPEGPPLPDGPVQEYTPGPPGRSIRPGWLKKLVFFGLPVLALAVVALLRDGNEDKPSEAALPDSAGIADVSEMPDSLPDEHPRAGDLSEGPVPGMTFSFIPSGSFRMGSPDSEPGRDGDEEPMRQVEIESLEIMTTEVTQEIWQNVMASNPSNNQTAGCPVENVSWDDCNEFIGLLNELDQDNVYRLPSESEWEYACRAGTGTPWFWGIDTSSVTMGEFCWYEANSGGDTHAAGLKAPNDWGLHDMIGNVLEWCEDYYHTDLSGVPEDGSPMLAAGEDSTRVVRGGSARNTPSGNRSASRSSYAQTGESPGIGFRVVRVRHGE